MGRMGVGSRMNENGVRLGSFCLENDLVIGGTLFQHLDIHKATWVSPCGSGKYKNQLTTLLLVGDIGALYYMSVSNGEHI